MFIRTLVSSAILAAAFGGFTAAQAATFTLEETEVVLTGSSSCGLLFACADVVGTVEAGSFDLDKGSTTSVDELITWSVTGKETGVMSFGAVATLSFTTPEATSGSVDGKGEITVSAEMISGVLKWEDAVIDFADGELLVSLGVVDFGSSPECGFDLACTTRSVRPPSSTTSSGTFTYSDIAAVPLPASVPLLMAGLGAIGWVGRRKKR